ncbi:MAG: hypothetical protein JNL01_14295 [Bdellovibrionales bacterium]|nr:hypothetical protein [Bdellovibrionales bacterium]
MKSFFLLTLFSLNASAATQVPSAPFPIFLKSGYSTVLEFEEMPSRVVLGDGQAFQVERLERSIIIKTLTPYASTNMFVYFRSGETKLFVLTASEDAQPTYYKKFETQLKMPESTSEGVQPKRFTRSSRVRLVQFDTKKDYLTIEAEIMADANEIIRPNWALVRLKQGSKITTPVKLWSERKDIQKDSSVKSRFVFAKPNVTRSLEGAFLVIPLANDTRTISLPLKGGRS